MGNYQRPGGDHKSDLTVNERFVRAFEKNGLASRFHACDRFTTTPTAREITSKEKGFKWIAGGQREWLSLASNSQPERRTSNWRAELAAR